MRLLFLALVSRSSWSWGRPVGSVARVNCTSSFLPAAAYSCWSWASALLRRSLAASSSMTPSPSMSKSTRVRLRPSMTRLYWVLRAATEVQAWPSSVPAAPPNEAITSPPAARLALIAEVEAGVGDGGVTVVRGVAAAAVDDEGEGEVLEPGGVAGVGHRRRRGVGLDVGRRVLGGEAGTRVGRGAGAMRRWRRPRWRPGRARPGLRPALSYRIGTRKLLSWTHQYTCGGGAQTSTEMSGWGSAVVVQVKERRPFM